MMTLLLLQLMHDLKTKGHYAISETMKENMADFYGGYADDTATVSAISKLYKNHGYTVDTHTAVAYQVYTDYVNKTGDKTQTLIASTAEPLSSSHVACLRVLVKMWMPFLTLNWLNCFLRKPA